MASYDEALAELTGPGGMFEVTAESVLGVTLQVYAQRMRSLRELVVAADARVDVDFLVQGDRRLTYAEHNALVRRVAQSMLDLGIAPGDRVAILSANNVEWVVMFWATAAIGAVMVPLNAWWKAEELQFALEDSGCKLLFADARRWDVTRDVVDTLPALQHVFVMDHEGDERARPGVDLLGAPDPGTLPDVDVAEDDLLAIMYTSGTTGRPKGATVTHRQAIANLQNIFCNAVAGAMSGNAPPELSEGGGQSATLLVVPLFHVTGCLATMMLSYATGAKLVLMTPGRFDPSKAMDLIERERVNAIGGVPTIVWRILEAPDFADHDLSSVSRISYGGAPAAPELVERIKEAFPKVKSTLTTAYGLTETASVATANVGNDYLTHPGSVGRAVPTVEVRVVDPATHADVPVDEAGEIWLRGPTIMVRGYWNRPDANAEALTEGWFHTGDIGRLDADGFLYLVDRAKDMIIRGGENVYCVEVEHVLFEHPDVVDAAVVGVPHRELGEEVKAVVQLRPGSTATVDDIRAFCAKHLANFKVPEYVEIRDEPLPRNPAGKVLKNQLRGDATAFAAHDDAVL
ncbi:MAG TPA: class I adenylate-forming enzyme family protein [Acidimicrobiia bacterium]